MRSMGRRKRVILIGCAKNTVSDSGDGPRQHVKKKSGCNRVQFRATVSLTVSATAGDGIEGKGGRI